jgi:folate-dependent phosphoribosylglycinamide formyltransferase PurN
LSGRVVLLAGEGPSTNIVFNRLARRFDVAAVVLEDAPSRARLVRNRVRRLGPVRVAGQLAFQLGVTPVLAREGRARLRELEQSHDLDTAAPPSGLVRRVASANDPATAGLLRELDPAVVVINGTRILSADLLEAVDAPFVNVHAGMTLRYRGVHGGFWALAEGRPEWCGVTVHLVDAGVDSGPVLAQGRVEPAAADNFATYPMLQLAAGLPLLERAVADLLAGGAAAVEPAAGPSALWYHPTLREYLRARFRHGVR